MIVRSVISTVASSSASISVSDDGSRPLERRSALRGEVRSFRLVAEYVWSFFENGEVSSPAVGVRPSFVPFFALFETGVFSRDAAGAFFRDVPLERSMYIRGGSLNISGTASLRSRFRGIATPGWKRE